MVDTAAMREAWERDCGVCMMCLCFTRAAPHHIFVGEDRKIKEYHAEDADAIITLCGPAELYCHDIVHKMSRVEVVKWLTELRERWSAPQNPWYRVDGTALPFPWERVYQILLTKYG